MAKRRPRKLSGKRLTNKLDKLVREIIRIQHPNPICFVCGKNPGWFHPQNNKSGCQTGHYISRKHFVIRWDMKNIYPQCVKCNYNHNLNSTPTTLRILEVYGEERLIYLNDQCNGYTGFTTLERRKILTDLETMKQNIRIDNLSVK